MNEFSFYKELEGHTGPVYALCNDSSKTFFYTAGSDGIIAKWYLNSENATAIAKLPHKIFCMTLVDNSTMIAGTSSGGIYMLDLSRKTAPRNIQFDTSICYNVLAIDSNQFITAQESGKLICWNSENGSIIKSITLSDSKLRGLCCSETELFVGTGEGVIMVLDKATLTIKEQFQAHQEHFGVNCLLAETNQNLLISGGKDGHLNFWELDSKHCIEKIPAHNYALYHLTLNSDGSTLLSSSRDKSVKFWNIKSRKFIQKIKREKDKGHLHSVNRVIWLSENLFVSVGDDKKVITWTNKQPN